MSDLPQHKRSATWRSVFHESNIFTSTGIAVERVATKLVMQIAQNFLGDILKRCSKPVLVYFRLSISEDVWLKVPAADNRR